MTKKTKHQQQALNSDLTKAELVIAPVPMLEVIKRSLRAIWSVVWLKELVCDVRVLNAKGKRTLEKLEKEGYIMVDISMRFTDTAIRNMMSSYDAKTRRMEITGKK